LNIQNFLVTIQGDLLILIASSSDNDGDNCNTNTEIFSLIGESDDKNEKTSTFTLSNIFSCVIIYGNLAINLKYLVVAILYFLTVS